MKNSYVQTGSRITITVLVLFSILFLTINRFTYLDANNAVLVRLTSLEDFNLVNDKVVAMDSDPERFEITVHVENQEKLMNVLEEVNNEEVYLVRNNLGNIIDIFIIIGIYALVSFVGIYVATIKNEKKFLSLLVEFGIIEIVYILIPFTITLGVLSVLSTQFVIDQLALTVLFAQIVLIQSIVIFETTTSIRSVSTTILQSITQRLQSIMPLLLIGTVITSIGILVAGEVHTIPTIAGIMSVVVVLYIVALSNVQILVNAIQSKTPVLLQTAPQKKSHKSTKTNQGKRKRKTQRKNKKAN